MKESKLSDRIYFYDDNSAKGIARIILSINIRENFDSKGMIKKFDHDFTINIKKLLGGEIKCPHI